MTTKTQTVPGVAQSVAAPTNKHDPDLLKYKDTETPATYEEALELIAEEIVELICEKHHDYGHENLKRYGEFGILVRISDKVSRIEHTLNSPAFVNESREDSWRDIVGYALQALMLQSGYLDLPTSEM